MARSNGVSIIALLAGLMAPGIAAAHTQSTTAPLPPAPGEQQSDQRDRRDQGSSNDIIVTAQRRDQALQDVPISITALTAAQLDNTGTTSTESLSVAVPGLVMSNQRGGLTPFLRGVGSPTGGVGTESSIAMYVDGVYIASAAGSFFSFNNIERIEVLKGPQGTLFGRNATGGLIQIITREPSQNFTLDATLGYANYNTVTGSVYASGPVSSVTAADFAFYIRRQGDGWGHNLLLGEEVNINDELAFRSSFLIKPNDDFSIRLTADYNNQQSDVGQARQLIPGWVAFDRVTMMKGTIWDTNSDVPRIFDMMTWGLSARVKYDLGPAELTSTTAYRNYRKFSRFDQDGGPVKVIDAPILDDTDTFQQELLLVGGSDKFDWTTGVFYFYSKAVNDPLGIRSAAIPPQNLDRFSDQRTRSYSAFAQATFSITPTTRLTGGLRYTHEKRKIIASEVAVAGNPRGAGTVLRVLSPDTDPLARQTANKLTWRAAIDQDITPDVLVYASASRGFRSGSYNNTNPFTPPVRPEVLDAYEVGLKSQFWDHRITFNAAGFYYDFQDIQQTRSEGGVIVNFNAAQATIKGIEAETSVRFPMGEGQLELRGAATYLDGKYDSFKNAPFVYNPPAVCTPGGPTPGVLLPGPRAPGGVTCAGDASGNDTIQSPKWSGNISAELTVPAAMGTFGANVTYSITDDFFWTPDELFPENGYGLLNGQLSLTAPDESWRIAVWGKNLTKTEYYNWISAGGVGAHGAPGAPRTYGITLSMKYGK
ncbi:MAG: TonB-dependent receptor [Alphaproteobacteria bacterium]|nr:TonB-dependent receptor [Alphaproteobacteria bacterium]